MTQQPLSTTAPPITTLPSSSNPNCSNHQTSHDSHLRPKQNPNIKKEKKEKKKPYIHNNSSTKLTLQPLSPLIVTSNRHLQFIVIHNPTTKLLTTEYNVIFVVKSALKAFWWRSCWSQV